MNSHSLTWSQLPTLVAKNVSVDLAPIPILWLDKNGIVGYANKQACSVFGFTPESLVGQTMDYFCSSIQLAKWQTEWWPIVKDSGGIESLPMTLRHRKGTPIQRNVSVSLVEAAGLFFAALYLLPKQSDHEVIQQEDSTGFLDILGESVCIMDRSGTIRYANPTFCRKFAVAEADLVGQPFLEFFSPKKSQLQKIWDSLQQETPSEVEFECQNMADESLVLRMDIVPQKNDENECSQLLVSFVDITEQHRITKKLESHNASFERLASNIPGFIYKFRMTPEGNFSFPYASKGCQEIFGVEPASVSDDATPIVNTIHPEDLPEFQNSVLKSAQNLSPWNLEARLSTVEDEWKWFHAASRPERQDNGDIIWEGLVMDVTARKQAEAELAEAKEIAEASANSRAEFLANMSHEIRTPLNAIIGLTRLALSTDLSPIQSDYIRKVLSSSEMLLGIINSILDFSKIESGKLNIEKIDFYLDTILENVGNILESKAAEKGIELLIDTPSNNSFNLVGDPLKLEQVLINLCNNAIKFTEQGEILISVKPVESSSHSTKLRFSVKDTGIGLSTAQQEKIFESFTQADSSTTRKYGGTGLGLSICKHMSELMGGEIGVNSEPDKGSEFYFTAVFNNQISTAKASENLPQGIHGKRVLFVDDNLSSRTINEKIIQSMGLDVTVLDSGNATLVELESALKHGEQQLYDLVVIDWDMPDMDGVATVEAIRSKTKLEEIPIVMMISSYGIDRFKSIIDRGVIDRLINKPVIRSNLVNTICGIFNGDHDPADQINEPDPMRHKNANISGLHVLLVEDNEINQEIACAILENMGAEVSIANNGREAIDKIFASHKKITYDAVLMDLQMPEMDGFEATKHIRQDQRFDELPIIAMTAHAFESEKNKCLDAGMQDHVSKPIDPERLASALSKWVNLEGKRPVDTIKRQQSATQKPASETEIDSNVNLTTINLSAAKKMLNDDTALLTRMLHKFAEEQVETIDTVRKHVESGDHENAADAAHRIKGIAGNLHITELFDSASRLEDALIKQKVDEADLFLEEVESEFSRFTEDLKALDRNKAALSILSSPQIDPNEQSDGQQKLPDLLDQFIEFLDADNFKAEHYLSQLKPHLKGTFDLELGQLMEYVANLDFKAASNIARAIRAQLAEPCQI